MNDQKTNEVGPKSQVPGKIKVRWLRAHHRWSYSAGNVCLLSSEQVEKLSILADDQEPFIEILPDDWTEPVPEINANPAFVKVRFLKPHSAFAYKEGSIGVVTVENAVKLLEDDFIEVLPDDYKEAPIKKEDIPSSEYIEVKWLKNHKDYAYSAGNIGKVIPAHLDMLLQGGYVDIIITKNDGSKQKILTRLQAILKHK
jgi:hypothetical protein